MHTKYVFLLCVFLSRLAVHAQCEHPLQINASTINDIHDPYEITFLHEKPQHIVDSFLVDILNKPLSFTEGVLGIERIGKSRSNEAFAFLYLMCKVSANDISNNRFRWIGNSVRMYNAFNVLNTYFLANVVDEHLPELIFRKLVLKLCEQKAPISYYCKQITELERYTNERAGLPIKKFDRKIIRIIRKHSDLRIGRNAESIEQQVRRLHFVQDVLWDGCYEKICIYPGFSDLAVLMKIHGKDVERIYHMKTSKLRYLGLYLGPHFYFRKLVSDKKNCLDYKHVSYGPDYIKKARAYCEKVKHNEEEK